MESHVLHDTVMCFYSMYLDEWFLWVVSKYEFKLQVEDKTYKAVDASLKDQDIAIREAASERRGSI